ncbi:cytochrome P450 [Plenodomus tracheiphilus IPT5]|uniref:Cytochrome P450 n=1 Tax=Plenodomus tracheiphilus IPT5 TaxID=1408161 RepID=A0A6A7BLC9_9PLEO|nr:cytochrome P450 [Plenodomus tracheiphilus IPT5]
MALLDVSPWTFVGLIAFSLILYRLQLWVQDRNKLPLPPQPPGLPILGNMVDIIGATNKAQQHLLFEQWAREYGEVVRVEAGPFTEYFLNSDASVKEIFDKQSSATSERPRWIVSNEQICDKKNVLLLSASEPRWKHQRKVILQGMTSVARADAGIPYLHYETAKFVHEVANDPALASSSVGLFNSIGRYTYSTFASQTFGMDVPNADDPVIDYIFKSGLKQILGTLPGMHIVDILPFLENLPDFLKPWKRNARALFHNNLHWSLTRMHRIEANMHSGEISDSFLSRVLQDDKHMGFSDKSEGAYLALMLIMGAADTSKMSTWSFLEAMMRFPDVQATALAHIEAVVGVSDRLPRYEDLEKTPYVRCLMKEVWRWRPPVSLGHPHTTTKELVYGGYRIPAGARLHLNSWAIGHDPLRHQHPERFWPERYEGDLTNSEESKNSADVKNRDHFAFGSGRRICPGYHVADRSLAIAIMRLVWAFEIVPAKRAKLPLDPRDWPGEMPGNPGEHMPVMLRVRSEAKRKCIDEERTRAEAERPAVVGELSART